MKQLLSAFLLSCLFAAFTHAQQNVILIIADDLGSDYCGFYASHEDTANMPHIRSLLSKGVKFTNAWGTPYCSPTRASIITGRYSFRTGVGTVIAGPGSAQLDTAEITIGKLLKKSGLGFSTANIGKWHLNLQTNANLGIPNYMGYDHYEGNFLGAIGDYYNWNKYTNGAGPTTVTNYATSENIDDAIAWLESIDKSKPFFLWTAFNAPHSPYHLPPANLHTVPGLTGAQNHINAFTRRYFRAMIEAMDTETGRLMQWLADHNLTNNTNIIFIGDNGLAKRVSLNPDTSHYKGTLYEYGLDVPFVISGPAVVSPGRTSDALVSTTDLFATILDISGFANWKTHIPTVKPVDAVSLMPILKNQADAVRTWNFTEQFEPQTQPADGKAIRNENYKLICFDDGRRALYHLAVDPNEQVNLLDAPLTAAATSNYIWLCNRLQELLGQDLCSGASSTTQVPDQALRISPNPASGLVTIFVSDWDYTGAIAEVFDGMGKKVFELHANGPEITLDLQRLRAGRYMVRLQSGARAVHGFFVKI